MNNIDNIQMTADEIASFCDAHKCSIFYSKGVWHSVEDKELPSGYSRTINDPDFEVIANHIKNHWGG